MNKEKELEIPSYGNLFPHRKWNRHNWQKSYSTDLYNVLLYVSKVCDCMACITDIIGRSHKVQIFITLRLMCFVVSQVCDCMACWLCIPWGDICGWNMGPDNTPDITSHHLHNLYHRFIRRQSFEKESYNKRLWIKIKIVI